MSGPIDPIRRVSRTQPVEGARAHGEDGSAQHEPREPFEANLPMVIAQPAPHPDEESAPTLPPPVTGSGPFAAQLLGQPGIKRGLRGGPETLDAARSTYLENEYSGPNDRRPPKGRIAKTEI